MRIETEVALSYLKSGLSVLPAERQRKRPIGAWRMYAERLPTEIEVGAWFANNPDGVCLVCGKVSGNLECIDFDAHGECFKAWTEKLEQTLFDKLVIERTPSGGYHVLYRATEPIEGNRKLAQGVRDGKKTTLIETRGEGGLFLCAPTEGYRLLQGAFTNLPTLSQNERQALLSAAVASNECVADERQAKPTQGHGSAFLVKPGDDWCARGDIRPILIAHGWKFLGTKPDGNELWQRPGKSGNGNSATFNGQIFCIFSTNAEPFEAKGYNKFQVYALLEHNGDFTAAANALLAQGYGTIIPTDADCDLAGIMSQCESVSPNVSPKNTGLEAVSITDLVAHHPSLRPVLIEDFLRLGETMNVIAPPKTGKSWLVIDLALAVATGRSWFGHPCTKGKVLMIDNELHAETSANRIPKVMEARGIQLEELGDNLAIANQRGRLMSVADLGLCIEECRSVGYKLIIIDAFYRAMPKDVDENDNGAVTSVYNLIDRYAQEIGCAFVLVHHTSKGNQSQKSVTDVGAGAGAQSRAADTHIILRRHKEKDVVVMDSVVRSFKSVPPICLRWLWPVWNPEPLCDPVELDGTKLSAQKRTATDEELVAPLVAYFGQLKTSKPLRTAKFLKKAQDKFAPYATKEVVKAALDEAIERGHLISERQKDAPRGQQSTRYLNLGDAPIADTERQLAFAARIPA